MEVFLIQANPNAYIKTFENGEIVISNDYTNSLMFRKIGEAMNICAQVNFLLGTNKFKIITYYKRTTVPDITIDR